jgi:FkbM family methyltransferase
MLNSQQQAELNDVRWLKISGEVHDLDFQCFRNMGDSQGLAIVDVGANRGQSIVSFKAMLPDARIVAFEANAFFGPVLSEVATWYESVDVFNVGLGRADQSAVLRVPVVDGKYYWEEGSIRPDSFEQPWVKARLVSYGDELRFEEYVVEIRRADSMLRDARADIVKIDVEGAELDVLSAMEDLLGRTRPVFMIENSDWHNVTAWLGERDYLCHQYLPGDNVLVPFSQACTNAFYLPAEYSGPLASIVTR